MGRQTETDLLILDDDYVNDVAADWYFLSLHFNASQVYSEHVVNELIERGIQLKRYLRHGGYTYLQPMNVCVDADTFFDIWLDADTDIQAGELYTNAD